MSIITYIMFGVYVGRLVPGVISIQCSYESSICLSTYSLKKAAFERLIITSSLLRTNGGRIGLFQP